MKRKPSKKTLNLSNYRMIQCADPLPIVDGQFADAQRDDSEKVIWVASHVPRWRWPRLLAAARAQAEAEGCL